MGNRERAAVGIGYARVSPYTDFGEPGCVSPREKTDFGDWLFVVLYCFSPLAKVFWKGEFEGKNLFFKKGFPLLIYCLLPTAYCLLPIAYCLLPTAYCHPLF